MSIAARCIKCGNIGCSNNNQLCNNKGELDRYLKNKFTIVYDGLYKSKTKWLGAGTGDDKSLYIDNTGDNTLIYWVENRGFEETIFDGRLVETIEDFEKLFDFLGIKLYLKW